MLIAYDIQLLWQAENIHIPPYLTAHAFDNIHFFFIYNISDIIYRPIQSTPWEKRRQIVTCTCQSVAINKQFSMWLSIDPQPILILLTDIHRLIAFLIFDLYWLITLKNITSSFLWQNPMATEMAEMWQAISPHPLYQHLLLVLSHLIESLFCVPAWPVSQT